MQARGKRGVLLFASDGWIVICSAVAWDMSGGGRLHDPHTPGQDKAIGVVMARMPFSY